MLHQESVADVLKDATTAGWGTALLGELAGERLDELETGRDVMLRARQRRTLRQRVGDHEQPLGRERLHVDRSAGRDLILAIGRELDDRRFLLAPRELPERARPK